MGRRIARAFKHLCPKTDQLGVLFAPAALFSLFAPVERAWSTDFDMDAYYRCIDQYVVNAYGSSASLLGMMAGPDKLTARVWAAFREEVGANDPTAMKSEKWNDLIAHKALVKPLIDPQISAVAELMALDEAKHDLWIGTYILEKILTGMLIRNLHFGCYRTLLRRARRYYPSSRPYSSGSSSLDSLRALPPQVRHAFPHSGHSLKARQPALGLRFDFRERAWKLEDPAQVARHYPQDLLWFQCL